MVLDLLEVVFWNESTMSNFLTIIFQVIWLKKALELLKPSETIEQINVVNTATIRIRN